MFNTCLTCTDKRLRNRLLMEKIDNENKILELKDIVRTTRNKHLSDLSSLERMRATVDKA